MPRVVVTEVAFDGCAALTRDLRPLVRDRRPPARRLWFACYPAAVSGDDSERLALETVLRENGCLFVATHAQDALVLVRLIERFWRCLPSPDLSLKDQIWKNLPWSRDRVDSYH